MGRSDSITARAGKEQEMGEPRGDVSPDLQLSSEEVKTDGHDRLDFLKRAGAFGAAAAMSGVIAENAIAAPTASSKKDVYVWISQNSTLPLFVNRVYPGLAMAAKELGVTVQKAGPTNIDLAAYIATVEQWAAKKPAGILVVGGWDPSLTVPVDKAIKQGVPTVVTDGDLPKSNRLSYFGTDWTQVGVQQARVMIAEHKARGLKKGKVATLSIFNADNMTAARNGFRDTLKGSGIEVVANEDDAGASDTAAQKAAALLSAHKDLTGFAGFDSESGPGIVTALREAGKTKKLVVSAMEQAPQFFKTVRDGITSVLMVENYEVMEYYAIQMLHNYRHSKLQSYHLSKDKAPNYPHTVDTGLIAVTKSNVGALLNALKIK
jgi:ribose transport system substrate-binding protein